MFYWGLLGCWLAVAPVQVCSAPHSEELSASGPAREIQFQQLGTQHGLSHNSVRSSLRDSRGFMWFGTSDGLNRYDGSRFHIYRTDPSNEHSLQGNRITQLLEDGKNRLWLTTRQGGLARYDRDSDRFIHYRHDPADVTTISSDFAISLCEDPEGQLWVGTYDRGLNRFDPATGRFTRYFHDPANSRSLASDFYMILHSDNNGNIWVGTGESYLHRWNPDSNDFTRFTCTGMNKIRIGSIFQDRDGDYWVGTSGSGLFRFHEDTGTFTRPRPKRGYNENVIMKGVIIAIMQDRNGILWFTDNEGGLALYDKTTGTFDTLTADGANPANLSNNALYSLYEDPEGIVWVGLQMGGVNIWNREKYKFRHHSFAPHTAYSHSSQHISGFWQESDRFIWVGVGGGGLYRFDRQSQSTKHFHHNPDDPNSLSSDSVQDLVGDLHGNLWVATYKDGLNRLDLETGQFYRYNHEPGNPNSPASAFTWTLNLDSRGTLWVNTFEKGMDALTWDPQKKEARFRHYYADPGNENSLNNSNIRDFLEDTGGRIWIATMGGGLNCLDPGTGTFTRYRYDRNDHSSIGSDFIACLFRDSKDNIWVGSSEGGLNRMNLQEKDGKTIATFVRYNEADGLPNNTIHAITEDGYGYLWISTNKGLARFHPENETFRNFTTGDGLQGDIFNDSSVLKTTDGEIYFGGTNGFNTFYPHRITDSPNTAPISFTGLRLFNQSLEEYEASTKRKVLEKAITETESIKLYYNQNDLTIEFAALNYTNSDRIDYAYMLDGYDNTWNNVGNRSFAMYTGLPPGEYVFRVMSANSDNVWNFDEGKLKISIIPPFWLTWWFIALAVMVAMIIVFLGYRFKVRAVRAQRKRLEEAVKKRTSEVQEKNIQLEKIDRIVRAINREVDLVKMLQVLLQETMVIRGIEKATALVYDNQLGVFRFKSALGLDSHRLGKLRITPQEAQARYTENAKEAYPDIFVVGDIEGRPAEAKFKDVGIPKSMMVLRIRDEEHIHGFLIFVNLKKENAFKQDDVELLNQLKSHVEYAFLKSMLMDQLHAERAKAEQANQSKSMFLARMSHEIRTPMNGVIGFTEMLLETPLNDEQKEFARTITRSGEALLTLINDILDFSRVEADQLTLESIDFDPEVTVFDICQIIMPRVEKKAVEVLYRIGDQVPAYVKGDPSRFRQVLLNLMGNAAKFTENGEIELSLKVDQSDQNRLLIHARVRDTGIGIPAGKINEIFDVFKQVDETTTRKFGGSGLGLAISRQIANLMEGDVWAESTPGEGSTFHFTAWLQKSPKKTPERVKLSALVGKRILVIDDNKNNLDILEHVLSQAGMQVTALNSGKKALAEILEAKKENNPYDICILDIILPEISGLDVAATIREQEDSGVANIPLLAFSSSMSKRYRHYRESGFNGFLPKPLRRHTLLKMVARLLSAPEPPAGVPSKNEDTEIVTRHSLLEEIKHSLNILLVEDNPVNQKLGIFILKRGGYNVTLAVNGKEAVEKINADPEAYDMVFMDVQMPEMDGITATQTIRMNGFSDLPIIAMTAEAMKGDRERCLAAGMNDYISKPIKREKIFDIVKKWTFG